MSQGIQSWVLLSVLHLIPLLMMIPKSAAVPNLLAYYCPNTTMFSNNSQYRTNLNTVFGSLASNATNPSGYSQAVAGNSSNNTVYGHFLCRGDMNASTCQDCVDTATTTDLPQDICPNRIVAIIWYDECMVRYSNQSFFGIMDQGPYVQIWDDRNITGNQTRFTELLGSTMNDVAVQAANDDSGRKFATRVANINSSLTLYALGECTPDLSPSDCNLCLRIAIGRLQVTFNGSVLMPSCNVRYATYPFFGGGGDTLSPPENTSRSGKLTSTVFILN